MDDVYVMKDPVTIEAASWPDDDKEMVEFSVIGDETGVR